MLNISHYQRKANQNYNETSPHTSQNRHHEKSTKNKCWRGCGEKGTLAVDGNVNAHLQPLWKTVWRFLKKLGIKPPYDPTIPILGIYPEETKTEKDTWIPLFTAALITIVRTWKQLRCPSTDEWIKKLWYIHNGILLAYKKECI